MAARLTGMTCVAVAVVAAVATAQGPQVQSGDLDGDAAAEQVRVVDEKPDVPVADIARYRVRISDTCPAGPVDVPVSKLGARVDVLELVRADTRRGREVFFGLADSGRGGWADARVVAWRRADSPCRRPRDLLRFPPAGRGPKPPAGGDFRADWDISLSNFSARYRGLEARLDEWYTDADDPISRPTILRRTFYRYGAGRDRYRVYRKVVKRNQKY